MKTFHFFLLVVAIPVVNMACDKSDDDTGNPATSPLYGSWKAVALQVSGCNNPAENHSSNCASAGSLCDGTIEFTRTTLTSTGIMGTSSTGYSINGNTYNFPSDGGVPTTFAIAGTTLTLTYQQSVNNGGCLIVSTYVRN